MKTMKLRRHTIKQANNLIGAVGAALARLEGEKEARVSEKGLQHIFFGAVARCAQTAMYFLQGYIPFCSMPKVGLPIEGLSNEALLAEINSAEFQAQCKAGLTPFHAALAAHGKEKCRGWANAGLQAVQEMFSQMEEGETAVGFFHTPVIEFVAWAIYGFNDLTPEFAKLNDLEGIVFRQEAGRTIFVDEKIEVTPPVN